MEALHKEILPERLSLLLLSAGPGPAGSLNHLRCLFLDGGIKKQESNNTEKYIIPTNCAWYAGKILPLLYRIAIYSQACRPLKPLLTCLPACHASTGRAKAVPTSRRHISLRLSRCSSIPNTVLHLHPLLFVSPPTVGAASPLPSGQEAVSSWGWLRLTGTRGGSCCWRGSGASRAIC